jgi:hypothetical protein
MTNQEKANLLRTAIDMLSNVNVLQQYAVTGDACYDIHNRIEDLISDFEIEVESLEG